MSESTLRAHLRSKAFLISSPNVVSIFCSNVNEVSSLSETLVAEALSSAAISYCKHMYSKGKMAAKEAENQSRRKLAYIECYYGISYWIVFPPFSLTSLSSFYAWT